MHGGYTTVFSGANFINYIALGLRLPVESNSVRPGDPGIAFFVKNRKVMHVHFRQVVKNLPLWLMKRSATWTHSNLRLT